MNIHIGEKWGNRYDKTVKLTIDYFGRLGYYAMYGVKLPQYSEMLDRIYEQFPEFLPNKDDVVYDIGAQYGDYSLICSKIYNARKVYAWEPIYGNYLKMHNLFWNHDLSYGFFEDSVHGDINFYNYALSDKKEEKIMKHNGMLSTENEGKFSAKIRYEVLDDILKSNLHMLLPTLMKIDVEGYEMKVLMGALRVIGTARPRIIVETHTIELENEVRAFLKNLNYAEPKEYGRKTNKDGTEHVNLFFMPNVE